MTQYLELGHGQHDFVTLINIKLKKIHIYISRQNLLKPKLRLSNLKD